MTENKNNKKIDDLIYSTNIDNKLYRIYFASFGGTIKTKDAYKKYNDKFIAFSDIELLSLELKQEIIIDAMDKSALVHDDYLY